MVTEHQAELAVQYSNLGAVLREMSFGFVFVWGVLCDLSSLSRIKPMPPVVEAKRLNHWASRQVQQRDVL